MAGGPADAVASANQACGIERRPAEQCASTLAARTALPELGFRVSRFPAFEVLPPLLETWKPTNLETHFSQQMSVLTEVPPSPANIRQPILDPDESQLEQWVAVEGGGKSAEHVAGLNLTLRSKANW